MIISLIAAMDKNRLIGADNALPWHLPADFRHFKEVTMNKPIIMGRKTFESIGKALPGRKNIVISRQGFNAEEISVADSINAALELADDAEEVMIIGGSSFYEQIIDRADRLYLTLVDAECEGDAWFPAVDKTQWHVIQQQFVKADDKNNYNFEIATYERIQG